MVSHTKDIQCDHAESQRGLPTPDRCNIRIEENEEITIRAQREVFIRMPPRANIACAISREHIVLKRGPCYVTVNIPNSVVKAKCIRANRKSGTEYHLILDLLSFGKN